MAYVIVVKEDNSLSGSSKIKIMQREKLFNKLWILVAPYYNGYDMLQCTVTMRYLLPISKEFKTETLILSEERYKEYLKYTLPIDTDLTKEHGDIELNLTFTMLDVDVNGNIMQRVRKTENHLLHITQIPDWDSVIPDSALTALDQRILKQDAQIKALQELSNSIAENKADNLEYDYETNELQLLSGDKRIGDRVALRNADEELKDGIPVVDFSDVSDDDNDDEIDNVVDFSDIESEEQDDFNNVVTF